MIPLPPEEQKKEAFRLFEDGRYQESLLTCNRLLDTCRDPALEVLAATNLFYTGRHEDAEVFFRDLAVRMPDSSYVHSYLAKLLEARGDEGAIAEYAAAVHLDPTNQDAVRSYADYLLARRDYRGALPVLRRLVGLGKKPEDIRNLMRALIEIGDAEEALAIHAGHGDSASRSREYIDALMQTHNYQAAAESAFASWRETNDPVVFRTYLKALSHYDMQGSLDTCEARLEEQPDCAVFFEYIHLLQTHGETTKALSAIGKLLVLCPADARYRLMECDLLAVSGNDEKALAHYEKLVRDELASKNDIDTLGRIIKQYRQYITHHLPAGEAERRFLAIISRDMHVASLLETARFFQDCNKPAEARSWYYRAYRADFLAGGPEYALFLAETGEDRECEKVMLYILSNVRREADVSKVASIIVREGGRMRTMKRLMDQLIKKMEGQRASLSTRGRELLAIAFFLAASNALEGADYSGCKYLCLSGIDTMPAHTKMIRLGDFLTLVGNCKEQALADRPVIHDRPGPVSSATVPPAEVIADQLGLTEQEQKIVGFLRLHRKANEMELRTLLGTRRVVGIVNRLIQKAASREISLIEKKGMGKEGEIYEYTGS